MNAVFGSKESLAASAFRAIVRPALGTEATQRYEDALLGRPPLEQGDAKTSALLRFACEFREGAAVEDSVRRVLLPAFSEDEALALVAFAGTVKKHRAVFETTNRIPVRMLAK